MKYNVEVFKKCEPCKAQGSTDRGDIEVVCVECQGAGRIMLKAFEVESTMSHTQMANNIAVEVMALR